MQADQTPAQRAKFTAARKKAYLAAHPQTKRGGDRQTVKGKQSANLADSFVKDTAGKTGKPERTIRRDVARAEALGNDIDRVAGTSLDKGVELDALAALSAGSVIVERPPATPIVRHEGPMEGVDRSTACVLIGWQ